VARRDFVRGPGRRLEQEKRFLIVVEGQVTEREYLEAIKRSRQMKSIEVRIEHGNTDPVGIVDNAKRIRDAARRAEPFDEVWCVFDVEAKLTQPARPGFADAINAAEQSGILCAISNPCFEIWLSWHSADRNAWIASDAAQRLCIELGITQEVRGKHLRDASTLIANGYEAAKVRAKAMEQTHDRDGQTTPEDRNPSSGMYRLVDAIYAAFPPR
jgi:hypothetical protein